MTKLRKEIETSNAAGVFFLTGGEFSRISRDGNYATIEKWAANGNKICRYETYRNRLHGRQTEWDVVTGNIILDVCYNNGHRIDVRGNRIY